MTVNDLTLFGTMSVGAAIRNLENVSARDSHGDEKPVRFDFCQLVPGAIQSYRGYYDHLAVGWVAPDHASERVTVPLLLSRLKSAIGETFDGYKGGSYRMSESTPLWVANWGDAGYTQLVRVVESSVEVILVTRHEDVDE